MYIYIISVGKFGPILLLKFESNNLLVIWNQGIKRSLHPIKTHKGDQKSDLPLCLEKSQEANSLISQPLWAKALLVLQEGN